MPQGANFQPKSALHNPVLTLSDENKRSVVDQLVDPFKLTKEDAAEMKQIFLKEILSGLSADANDRKSTCLLMGNTFMNRLPSATEKGDFLSLDLGSTNFRVILSRLKGGKEENEFEVKYYDVPSHLRVGHSTPLFDFLAQCVQDFIDNSPGLKEKKIPLGFSFSYPMEQSSVDSGYLVAWTKSYDLPDAVGQDAVTLLRNAIDRRPGLNVDVVAILNDSTGTLLKGAYLDPDCTIGMIFGSGFNACYVEQQDRIPKLSDADRQKLTGSSMVAIDIECGGFGDNGCIDKFKTIVDQELDQDSLFPSSFSFEKMLAGNFIGEIVRRILVKIAEGKSLFEGKVTDQLKTRDSIIAANLVQIARHEQTREIFAKLGYNELSDDDIKIIHYVIHVVVIRAAVLTSACE
jgi:hexokinase